jgi:type II secretory pathway pseudopilin PulG
MKDRFPEILIRTLALLSIASAATAFALWMAGRLNGRVTMGIISMVTGLLILLRGADEHQRGRRAKLANRRGFEPVIANDRRSSARSGFSFIEVLFAVIILGIGFIMIAALFPVAIQQSTSISNETAGQLVCRDAIRMISQAASAQGGSALFPSTIQGTNTTGSVMPFPYTPGANTLYQALGPNAFFSADKRYGWVGFYRRDSATSPYAQVFVIALQNPNFPNYVVTGQPAGSLVTTGVVPPPIPPSQYNAPPPTAPSYVVSLSLYTKDGVSTEADLSTNSSPSPFNACTGAFLLIAHDPGDSGLKRAEGTMTGQILRLGTEIDTTGSNNQFLAQPGMDANNSNGDSFEFGVSSSTSMTCYVIGRAPMQSSAAIGNNLYQGNFTGPNQDIAAMSAYITVNTATN